MKKYALDLVVEAPDEELRRDEVFVAVDIGVRKIVTLIAMNGKGEQVSRPIFIKTKILGKLQRLRERCRRLQEKLSRLLKDSKRCDHLYSE